MYRDLVKAFELLESKFAEASQPAMFKAFQCAFASKRRQLAKVLLGAGQFGEARGHLWRSLFNCPHPVSMAKSSGLLGLSFLPGKLQPVWPSGQRQLIEKLNESGDVPRDLK
jgi:hypothetical protein